MRAFILFNGIQKTRPKSEICEKSKTEQRRHPDPTDKAAQPAALIPENEQFPHGVFPETAPRANKAWLPLAVF